MTKLGCPICQGRGEIRLPVYGRTQIAIEIADCIPAKQEEAYRTYPCPECSKAVSEENVIFLHTEIKSSIEAKGDPSYREAAYTKAAHALVDGLIRHRYISFEEGPADDIGRSFSVIATVGAVSPGAVISMEERIAERQMERANDLVQMAVEEISNWGSHYTGNEGNISKDQAIDSVKKAFSKLVDRRKDRL